MYSIYSPELQLPTIIVAVVGLFVLSRHLPFWLAALLAVAKAAIPFTYFAGLWGCEWRLLDDMTYYESGYDMVTLGYGPLELILTESGRETVQRFANSRHTLYYTWNVLAQSLFGRHYFAAVYCNLLAVYGTSLILAQTLKLLQFSRGYLCGAVAFHALHWDYLTWTSLINVRESLVELIIWGTLYYFVFFIQKRQLKALVASGVCCLLLTSIRIYIPFMLVSATCVWLLVGSSANQKILLLFLGAAVAFFFRSYTSGYRDELAPRLLLLGTVRFVLTPQPWSIVPEYSFLLVPSVLQWIFIAPSICGCLWLWRTSHQARLFIIVLVLSVAMYGITPEAQGPRHRVQLAALFAWMGFHFLWAFVVGQPALAPPDEEEQEACPQEAHGCAVSPA